MCGRWAKLLANSLSRRSYSSRRSDHHPNLVKNSLILELSPTLLDDEQNAINCQQIQIVPHEGSFEMRKNNSRWLADTIELVKACYRDKETSDPFDVVYDYRDYGVGRCLASATLSFGILLELQRSGSLSIKASEFQPTVEFSAAG
jgi:hypothetical protein